MIQQQTALSGVLGRRARGLYVEPLELLGFRKYALFTATTQMGGAFYTLPGEWRPTRVSEVINWPLTPQNVAHYIRTPQGCSMPC